MRDFAKKKPHLITTASLCLAIGISSSIWFILPFSSDIKNTEVVSASIITPHRTGHYVVITLNNAQALLKDGTTTVQTLPIISQGKPGSYYETIGGVYANDYKLPLHFSSLGHVYMPYSVHLFGNYFIHGIPYHPNGEEVSSTYSGGCIRLSNENAKILYDFVETGTPIIVTRDTELSFEPTPASTSTMTSGEMTQLMVASISLETLSQDSPFIDTNGHTTTRRALIPLLVHNGDIAITKLYTQEKGEETFIQLMNDKAQAIGLTNTHFNDSVSPVTTTYEDYVRFMTYISTYKSYLRTIPTDITS